MRMLVQKWGFTFSGVLWQGPGSLLESPHCLYAAVSLLLLTPTDPEGTLHWAGYWDWEKKGREVDLVRMVWNSRASHCWLSLCGSSPKLPFAIHLYRCNTGSCSSGRLSLWWAGVAALFSQCGLLSDVQLRYLHNFSFQLSLQDLDQGLRVWGWPQSCHCW